jgi:hypothetical protein
LTVALEFPLHEICSAAPLRRHVRDADDAVDALAIEDSLAGRDCVAAEFDALAHGIAVPPGLGDGRSGHKRALQVAVAGNLRICDVRELLDAALVLGVWVAGHIPPVADVRRAGTRRREGASASPEGL